MSARKKVLVGVAVACTVAIGAAIALSTGDEKPGSSIADQELVEPAGQELAMLTKSQPAFAAADSDSRRLSTVRASRPITHGQTVLPVIDRTTTDGANWLRVMLPGRPNGIEGWIAEAGTVPATTTWSVVVKTSDRKVLISRGDELVRTFPAIVGKPSTPTPHGRFFVEESILMPTGEAGWPFTLALSARSNVLQEFDGGPGQIAIHGVANLGGNLGTAVSHGCVRLATSSIRWIAARIVPGAQVTIVA